MFELVVRFQIWEDRFSLFSKYLEIGGSGCQLVSKVAVEGTIALTVHWMVELGLRSVFRR